MKTEKILRSIALTGLFLVPFLPFLVAQEMFFPFITLKNFAFRALVEIMFVAWAALALLSPAYRPRKSWILISLSVFVGIMFVANVFGENVMKSIWSNYERMMGWVTLAHVWALFVVAISVLRTEKLWRRLFHVSLFASTIMVVYGFAQLAGNVPINQGGVRLDGTFGNATYLAVYALFHVFLAAFLAVRERAQGWLLWTYGAAAFLNAFILYQTATRGAILGLLGGAFLTTLLIALFGKEYPRARKWSGGIIAALVLIVGGFLAVKDTEFIKQSPVLNRFASISLEDRTVQARFIIWGMAFEGAKEHLVLGWGQGNFNYVFNKHYEPELYKQEPFFDRAHNIIFDWLVAGGALGLVAYLLIFIAAVYYLWRLPAPSGARQAGLRDPLSVPEWSILTGLLAAYFFQNLFVFDNMMSYVLLVFTLGFIHHLYVGAREEGTRRDERATTFSPHIVAAGAIIVAPLLIYAVNGKGYMTNHALLEAIKPQQGGIEKNIEHFERAFAYNSFGNAEAREQLVNMANRAIVRQEVPNETKQRIVAFARNEMEKYIAEDPRNARAKLLLGSHYNGSGQYKQAEEHLRSAIALSSGKQAIYFELVSTLVNNGKFDEALKAAREAYDLAPENKNAALFYGVAAVYAGDMELAEEVLTNAYGTMAVSDDRLVQAYDHVRRYDLLVDIWQKRTEEARDQGHDNPQFRLSLSAAYLQNGQPQKAIEEIERVMEIAPQFEQQGKHFINLIRAGRGHEILE